MARAKCYTPQLRRDVVSRLYHRAKAERVPMTVLANRLLELALNALGPGAVASAADNNEKRSA
jgi:hypothetical protein